MADVSVTMTGEADTSATVPNGPSRTPGDDEMGSPLWAASRLATAQSGTLIVNECAGATTMTLEFPASRS
jgi:hypothetical protein